MSDEWLAMSTSAEAQKEIEQAVKGILNRALNDELMRAMVRAEALKDET